MHLDWYADVDGGDSVAAYRTPYVDAINGGDRCHTEHSQQCGDKILPEQCGDIHLPQIGRVSLYKSIAFRVYIWQSNKMPDKMVVLPSHLIRLD